MNTFCVCIVLLFGLAAAQRLDIRLRALQPSTRELDQEGTTAAPDQPQCKDVTGFVCGGCKNLYYCADMGGELVPVPAQTCASTETCLNGTCTANPNPKCDDLFKNPFECNTVGVFPDPFDCKKYHFCAPKNDQDKKGEDKPVICGGGYGYNAKTKYCNKKLTNGACPAGFPVPICKKLGDNAALTDDAALYYVCLPVGTSTYLYPYLFACSNGGSYVGGYKCKAPV